MFNNNINNDNRSVYDLIYSNNSSSGGGLASLIINDSNVTGATVADALNSLLSGTGAIAFKRDIFTATANQVTFTLQSTPVVNSDTVDMNGQKMYPGVNYDYTITGSSLVFNYPIKLGTRIMANYF